MSRGHRGLSLSSRELSVGPGAEENLTITGQMQAMLTDTDLLLSEIRFRHLFGSSRNDRSVFNGQRLPIRRSHSWDGRSRQAREPEGRLRPYREVGRSVRCIHLLWIVRSTLPSYSWEGGAETVSPTPIRWRRSVQYTGLACRLVRPPSDHTDLVDRLSTDHTARFERRSISRRVR